MATVRFYFFWSFFFLLLHVDGTHSSLSAMRLRLSFFFFCSVCSRVECECPCLPTLRIPTWMQWTNDGWRRGRRWNEYMMIILNPQLWFSCYTNSARETMEIISKLFCCLNMRPGRLHNRVSFLRGLDGKSCLALRLPLCDFVFFFVLTEPREARDKCSGTGTAI